MSNKKIIALIAAVAFLALSAVSIFTVTGFISKAKASDAKTTRVHLAFAGLITTGQAKGTPIKGGLTEVIRSTGYFNGNLHLANGTQISTSGRLEDGRIAISFYNALGAPAIRGVGKITKAGDFVGTFQVLYANKKTDTGIWSALPVAEPKEAIVLDFVGVGTAGYDQNTVYTGALVLDNETLVGTLNLPNGTIVPVTATLNKEHVLKVHLHLSKTVEIVGVGTLSHQRQLKGYTGTFTGPVNGDTGKWVAYGFHF